MRQLTLRESRRAAIKRMTPYLRRVGEISSNWSSLEFNLDLIIWELLQTEQQYSACVTSQIPSAGAKLKSIKALVAVLDKAKKHEDIQRTLNKMGSDMEAVVIKRNRAVHDTWRMGVVTKRVSQFSAAMKGARLQFGNMTTTIRELDRTNAQIRALLKRSYLLEQLILGVFVPSPRRYVLGHFQRNRPNPRLRQSRGKAPKKHAAQP
jgi:hypothetical protein